MGFEMYEWDQKLLKYGVMFEQRIMDLSVNIPLFEALDRCWQILAECFEPTETGIRRSIIETHWPKVFRESKSDPLHAQTESQYSDITKVPIHLHGNGSDRGPEDQTHPPRIETPARIVVALRTLPAHVETQAATAAGYASPGDPGTSSGRTGTEEIETTLQKYRSVMSDRAGVPLEEWSRPNEVQVDEKNVAGVAVPVLRQVVFFGGAPFLIRHASLGRPGPCRSAKRNRREAVIDILQRQEQLLRRELTRIIQRVNLFEKIMIPQAVRRSVGFASNSATK